MKQKLIFLDIDGTLLPPGEMTVPASAVEAIRQARANGHKVFLCTGRNLRMTKPLLAYGFDGFVCSAGGYVGCDGKILVDLPMEPAQVEGLREVLLFVYQTRPELLQDAAGACRCRVHTGSPG